MFNFLDTPPDHNEARQELRTEVKTVFRSHNPVIKEVEIMDNHPQPTIFTELDEKEKIDEAKLKYNHLLTALTNPEGLKGFCMIYADAQLVYKVKDGQLLQDKFNLLSHFENLELEFAGQKLKQMANIVAPHMKTNISRAVAMIGKRRENGSIVYKDEIFTYKLENSQLSIRNTVEDIVIFNSTGFSDKATVEEMNMIMRLDSELEATNKLFKNHEQNLKSPKLRL